MDDDRPLDHHTVVARAVREYLVTGDEAVLDALTVNQRIDAERQIATHREAMRRDTTEGDTTQPDPTGAEESGPRYGRQLLYIVVGIVIALLCFWGVYTLPKLA